MNHWRMPGNASEANRNFWYSYDDGMVHHIFLDTETDLGGNLTGPDEIVSSKGSVRRDGPDRSAIRVDPKRNSPDHSDDITNRSSESDDGTVKDKGTDSHVDQLAETRPRVSQSIGHAVGDSRCASTVVCVRWVSDPCRSLHQHEHKFRRFSFARATDANQLPIAPRPFVSTAKKRLSRP
jgi:hypothetical protein